MTCTRYHPLQRIHLHRVARVENPEHGGARMPGGAHVDPGTGIAPLGRTGHGRRRNRLRRHGRRYRSCHRGGIRGKRARDPQVRRNRLAGRPGRGPGTGNRIGKQRRAPGRGRRARATPLTVHDDHHQDQCEDQEDDREPPPLRAGQNRTLEQPGIKGMPAPGTPGGNAQRFLAAVRAGDVGHLDSANYHRPQGPSQDKPRPRGPGACPARVGRPECIGRRSSTFPGVPCLSPSARPPAAAPR